MGGVPVIDYERGYVDGDRSHDVAHDDAVFDNDTVDVF